MNIYAQKSTEEKKGSRAVSDKGESVMLMMLCMLKTSFAVVGILTHIDMQCLNP